jgi:hypothetical protein
VLKYVSNKGAQVSLPSKHLTPLTKPFLMYVSAMMMILLLFLQKQNLASAIYLCGLGTRLSGQGLKQMR